MEQRYIDLINADFDGELSAAEKAELERFLSEDGEGRRFRAELEALGQKLSNPEPVEVPAGLRDRIVARIASHAPNSRRAGTPWWKPATALAAGLVLAVSLGVVLAPMEMDDAGPAASGTLVQQPNPLNERAVALASLTAELAFGRQGGTYQVRMELDGVHDVEATLEYEHDRLEIVRSEAFSRDGDSLRMAGAGKATATFRLREAAGAPGSVRMVFRESGQVVHTEVLEAPAEAGDPM